LTPPLLHEDAGARPPRAMRARCLVSWGGSYDLSARGPTARCGPARHARTEGKRGAAMLYYAVVFFIVALIAAVFGFSGIAAGAAGIAKILFVLFLIGAVVTFFISLSRRA
jgi:uncharacterized membrane protein YtjA (UPF0391 family)